jgi:intein/homing endonuclease
MVEQTILRRVSFPTGEQQRFLDGVLEKLSVNEVAKLCGLSNRTIRDWRREKFLMNSDALNLLCKKLSVPMPHSIELKDPYWYALKGASAGGRATLEKYGRVGGDFEYRKKKWHEWWEREGRHRPHPITTPKRILRPKYTKELAESVGIILGDGGISKYQVVVTLHATDDKEYGGFVARLIAQLFKVPVGIYPSKTDAVIDYVVSRIELVRFLEEIGLKQGNKIKQQVDIPLWIKNDKEYSLACVRGLVDTDGSVFDHRYKVNGKQYSYKKLSFTSRSEPLRQSVYYIMKDLGLRARLANVYDVRLDSKEDMKKYFQIVGSHNPKHLKRYQN